MCSAWHRCGGKRHAHKHEGVEHLVRVRVRVRVRVSGFGLGLGLGLG